MNKLISGKKRNGGRFNSQILSQKYYDRIMTPLNITDKVMNKLIPINYNDNDNSVMNRT